MLMLIPSAAARIAVFVFAGAFISAGPQIAPHLSGRVIDADTGQAVAGATIHLSGRRTLTVKTDSEGNYQSGTLLPGMYSVTVTREGYLPARALYAGRVPLRVRVREDGIGPATVRKDWMLERTARIAGRVLTDGGAPIEGVTVIAATRLRDADGWPEFEIKSSATTRADGRFEISNLARGPYVLAYTVPAGTGSRWMYSPGIADPRHASPVEAISGTVSDPIDLTGSSAPFPSVQITALAPGGGPASNTAIELSVSNPFPSMSRRDTLTAVTDSSGRATLSDVPAGRHKLLARTPSALTGPATARAAVALEIPTHLAKGIEVRLQRTVPACLLTRWESDGAAPEDMRSPPVIRATTRDGALVPETLNAQAQLGGTLQLPGLLPGSSLHVLPFGQESLWALTRFSPSKPAPRGLLPIDAAAAGCAAAYFRRTSQSIKGRVPLGDLEWVPEVEVLAIPIDSSSAPIAVSWMADDGTFHLNGIALGMQYDVIALPAGLGVDAIPQALRHIIKATGGNVITIPLSLPIAR